MFSGLKRSSFDYQAAHNAPSSVHGSSLISAHIKQSKLAIEVIEALQLSDGPNSGRKTWSATMRPPKIRELDQLEAQRRPQRSVIVVELL